MAYITKYTSIRRETERERTVTPSSEVFHGHGAVLPHEIEIFCTMNLWQFAPDLVFGFLG